MIKQGFLKKGDIVKSRKYGTEKWNTNVVFDVWDDILLLDAGILEESFSKIKRGNEFEVKVTKDEFEYSIDACVMNTSTTPIQTVKLKIEGVKKHSNMRKNLRHFVHLFSLIRKSKKDKDPVFAIVTDISLGGIAVLVNDKKNLKNIDINVGEEVFFEISLEDQRTVCFKGAIKRKKENDGSIDIGVQIKSIDKRNREKLEEYVNELKTTDKEFQELKQEIWEYNFGI